MTAWTGLAYVDTLQSSAMRSSVKKKASEFATCGFTQLDPSMEEGRSRTRPGGEAGLDHGGPGESAKTCSLLLQVTGHQSPSCLSRVI